MSDSTGLLLVGHGTRSVAGIRQFLDATETLATLEPNALVEPAFLELAQPDISKSVARLSERGASTIVVVPFLLAAADHVKLDIPAAVRVAIGSLAAHQPALIFAEHLGAHPNVLELSKQRFREGVEILPHVAAGATCHLLVGRGTSDRSAIAEVQQFARLRADPTAAAQTRLAFLAMATPTLAEELQQIAAEPFRRVVVQPHLLFEGDLVDSIRNAVAKWAKEAPNQEWLATGVLADPAGKPQSGAVLLAQAARQRFAGAIRVVGGKPDG